MRKFIIISFISLLTFVSCRQESKKPIAPAKQEIRENVRYKMFPTENLWTFLKLDTRSGKIWQVQYSVNDNYRGEVELNNKDFAKGDAAENGRFTLYPTKNMYNFILLDQTDGKMWQIQWSMEEENRLVIPMQ